MKMQEKSILTDCLESLKHSAECYQKAAFECDSDNVRELVQDIMGDRCEQQASVFNLMHQMGIYKTESAPSDKVQQAVKEYRQGAQQMQARHQPEMEATRPDR